MDAAAAFIVYLHLILGHDRCADYLGQPRGDKRACRLCRGEDPNVIYPSEVSDAET